MPFCGKCGTEYEEGGVCPVCSVKEQENVSKKDKKEKKEKKKKSFKAKFITVLVILIILAGTAAVLLVLYRRPLQPVNRIVKAFNKGDDFLEYAYASYPKEYRKFMNKYDEVFEKNYEVDIIALENMRDSLDDTFTNWKLGFETTSAIKAMDATELKAAEDNLRLQIGRRAELMKEFDENDYDKVADAHDMSDKEAEKFVAEALDIHDDYIDCNIEKGYVIKGRYVFSYDVGKERQEMKDDRVKFHVVQFNGEWIIADVEYQGIPFDDVSVWNYNYSVSNRLYQKLLGIPLY